MVGVSQKGRPASLIVTNTALEWVLERSKCSRDCSHLHQG